MATTHDLVRRFFPDASDNECEFWLWQTTCFPFGGVLTVARQLKRNMNARIDGISVCACCGNTFYNDGKVDFYDLCDKCDNDN